MAPPAPSQKPTDDKSNFPSETVRGIASLLLIVHLICVLVALSSNLAPSSLQLRLLDVLRPYTQTLNYDLNYTPYELTHGSESDEESRIAILPAGQEREDEKNWIAVGESGFRGGDRYQRYRRLAQMLAFLAGENDNNLTGAIAQSVSANFLHQQQMETKMLRCRRQERVTDQGQEFEEEESYRYPLLFRDVYLANVINNDGQVMVSNVPMSGRTARPDQERK